MKTRACLFAFLFCLAANPALAHWPSTVSQDVAIANSPTIYEGFPQAVAGGGNRTLIAYDTDTIGVCYQILDRFGNLLLPQGTLACPGLPLMDSYGIPKVVADDQGGMVIAWANLNGPQPGIYAERIDTLGNRLWGTSGVWAYPLVNVNFDICSDSQGGFWLAVAVYEAPYPTWWDIYVQRLSGSGQLLLGPTGVPVVAVPQANSYKPKLAPDGQGGCYLAWDDDHSPNPFYEVFAQHVDGQGQRLWNQDLYICSESNAHPVIPDGEGGFILQTNPGENFVNTHQRINPQGQILWTIQTSYDYGADMVVGQPGYFYLAYKYSGIYYAQKLSLSGGNPWGGGVPMSSLQPNWSASTLPRIRYRYPYLYGCFALERTPSNNGEVLRAQRLDSLGNRSWGTMGILMSQTDLEYTQGAYLSAVPDGERGFVAVWEIAGGNNVHDVYAKRANADGTLGGPFPLEVTLTPHNPPVQIPPQGGSFSYDIAVADTDTVGGFFDLWVEVILPNGDSLEITHRQHVPVQAGGTFIRNNLQQIVPPQAPPGIYSYRLYAGNWVYRSPWGQDEFTFVKLADSGQAGMTPSVGEWRLCGEPFVNEESPPLKRGAGGDLTAASLSPTLHGLTYTLPQAGRITLELYDLLGRKVAVLENGYRSAGEYRVNLAKRVLPSGVYLLRLEAGEKVEVGKAVVVK